MRRIGSYVIYTADDETPDCSKCDNKDKKNICSYCFEKYGWDKYKRRALVKDNIDKLKGYLNKL